MKDVPNPSWSLPPLPRQLDEVCDRFEAAWQAALAGAPWPRLEGFLTGSGVEGHTLLLELVALDVGYRRQLEEIPTLEEYRKRFTAVPPEWLARQFAAEPATVGLEPTGVARPPASATVPQWIGRYRVERRPGRRRLRPRLPGPRRASCSGSSPSRCRTAGCVARPEDAEAYLTEARTVANLDHPNIVPVYDVGSTEDFPCFVVSKYIDGSDPGQQAQASVRLSVPEAVELVATVAEACTTPTSKGWSIGTSSRATSCSTAAASRSWPISAWPCASRTSARGRATPGRPPT